MAEKAEKQVEHLLGNDFADEPADSSPRNLIGSMLYAAFFCGFDCVGTELRHFTCNC